MKWSVRLGRFFGIDVFLHFTFLLFFAWLGYSAWQKSGGDAVQTLNSVVLLAGVFTCVVLHEYGHALTARRFGIGTHDITLLPIGGVARLERMPSNPRQELLVAIAGPAVNLVIVAAIALWLSAHGQPIFQNHFGITSGSFLRALLLFNGIMICFNLLPAFPMDGGRVLRAILAMRMPYAKATRAAATVGQGMAVIFGLAGLMIPGWHMLLFIAFFVWIGASNEAQDAEEDALLIGLTARDAMMTDFRVLDPAQTAKQTAGDIVRGSQVDFPVVDAGNLVGLVTSMDVFRALETDGNVPVSSFMRAAPKPCAPADVLDGAVQALHASTLPLMPVLEGGKLVGLLTRDNLMEVILIRRAEAEGRRRGNYAQPPPLPVRT